ncbi:MAG: DsrE family protein [Candidatus Thiodiazotropha sp. (ex. Lucinoma kazani)]
MCRYFLLLSLLSIPFSHVVADGPREVYPAYEHPKVVYEFYLDEPEKISAALYWIRALINPLIDSPYDMAPEMMDIKVVVHGTEIVTLAKKNYLNYKDAVERMRYYTMLGVEFKVCGLAAKEFDYSVDDFHEFVELVPSAFTELAHWQQQGYALIIPQVQVRTRSIDEIR